MMELCDLDFDVMNETDVREDIIMPLLTSLNYRKGSENDIIREQLLKYPKSSLGRKQKNDPALRGKADYICEVKNKIRWVIEAKPPSDTIDKDAIEQAHSYAVHGEIRGIFFCICNGREFKIFQTNQGPNSQAIFSCNFKNFHDKYSNIKNILSPEAIWRDHSTYEPDYGEPLAPSLRSFAKLVNGRITYKENSLNLPSFNGMIMTIIEGAVERNQSGEIEAYIKSQVPYEQLQELNERLGLDAFTLISEDKIISNNPDKPTTFKGERDAFLPAGAKTLNLMDWSQVILPMNINVSTQTMAIGYLENQHFKGKFTASLDYKELGLRMDLTGDFSALVQ